MVLAKDETSERVLKAAAELFAERGFHGASMRELAQRAGVNVAAGHYHFGSKRDLYLTVLRQYFAEIRADLARRQALPPAGRASRARLVEVLRARAHTMASSLLGSPPSLHGTLMMREMADPSEALSVIVDEFLRPMMDETRQLLTRLAPRARADDLRLAACSLVAQILYFRATMPAALRMFEMDEFTPEFIDRLVDHVVEFSLGGLARIAPRSSQTRRSPVRRRTTR